MALETEGNMLDMKHLPEAPFQEFEECGTCQELVH